MVYRLLADVVVVVHLPAAADLSDGTNSFGAICVRGYRIRSQSGDLRRRDLSSAEEAQDKHRRLA